MYLQQLGFTTPAAYNDEPYAYFVQWVTDCIYSVLMDEPEEMHGKQFMPGWRTEEAGDILERTSVES